MKTKLQEEHIVEDVLDLEKLKEDPLNENMMVSLAAQLKLALQSVMGYEAYNLFPSPSRSSDFMKVRGKKSDIKALAKTLGREKKYLQSWKSHGLNDPKTYKSKRLLDKAISGFQKKTGIKWPFK